MIPNYENEFKMKLDSKSIYGRDMSSRLDVEKNRVIDIVNMMQTVFHMREETVRIFSGIRNEADLIKKFQDKNGSKKSRLTWGFRVVKGQIVVYS